MPVKRKKSKPQETNPDQPKPSKSKTHKEVGKSKKKKKKKAEVHYEFGGPPGAVGCIIALPIVIYFLYFAASKSYRFDFVNAVELVNELPKDLLSLWNTKAALVIAGWMVFNVFLERTLFHAKVEGVVLRDGTRLMYRISAHLQFWVVLLVMGHGCPKLDSSTGGLIGITSFPLAWIYDYYVQLATASIVVASLLSVFLYVKSFAKGAMLAEGGQTGNVIYDFFIGRELNPRILGDLDLKYFCELRPGLIGWAVINIGCMVKQYELQGYVAAPMVMINVFQGIYVFDAMYHERAILTTMDITTDGFGFMLAFGDLAWVPFTYSLQARYLVENSPVMSPLLLAFICSLNCLGYYIFRGSNSEKDAFRRDPNGPDVKHLQYLTTSSGRKLLTSGWWGTARKINYTGDWLMAVAWCMTTGFDCIVTYFYAIYFFILLVHRAMRDNHACSLKYGEDWGKYKAQVPYMFIPGVI